MMGFGDEWAGMTEAQIEEMSKHFGGARPLEHKRQQPVRFGSLRDRAQPVARAPEPPRSRAHAGISFVGLPERIAQDIAGATFGAQAIKGRRAAIARADDGTFTFTAIELSAEEAERGLRRFRSWMRSGR